MNILKQEIAAARLAARDGNKAKQARLVALLEFSEDETYSPADKDAALEASEYIADRAER